MVLLKAAVNATAATKVTHTLIFPLPTWYIQCITMLILY